MENEELKSRIPALKEKIKEHYPHITDQDLEYTIGQEAEFLLHVQEKLAVNKKQIDNWLSIMG
jgi:hypothetical protein